MTDDGTETETYSDLLTFVVTYLLLDCKERENAKKT